jgi:hypothetical protein
MSPTIDPAIHIDALEEIDQAITTALYRYTVRPVDVARRVLRARREAWSAASPETALCILTELGKLGFPTWLSEDRPSLWDAGCARDAAEYWVWCSVLRHGRYVSIELESAWPIKEVDPSATDWRAEMVIAPAEPARIYGSLRRQARRVLVVERGLLTARQVRRAVKRVAGILRSGGLEVDTQRVASIVLRMAEHMDDAPSCQPVRDFIWRHLHTAEPRKARRARQIAYDLVVGRALWDTLQGC